VAVKPDPNATRKLGIAKQLYVVGSQDRATGTPISRLLAVVHFDMAIETAVKTAIRSLDPRASTKGDFPDVATRLATALEKASLGDLPQAAGILHVHDIRNAAQHEGRLPTPEEEDECHTIARSFLNELLAAVWDRSLDSLRLADLIVDDDSRRRLDEAEVALAEGRYGDAIEKSAEALQWALLQVKSALVGRGDTWAKAILVEDSFRKPRASRDLTASIERTQETVMYLALGLDYAQFARYQAIAGFTSFAMKGTAMHYGAKATPDLADAEQVVGYVTGALVQIETRVTSIAKPFGRERWF
jgi:hypothetical protein